MLDLLLLFDSVCKNHGVRYSLDSGTLLGAVRHKGFIPWDDDIDVIVPRPDYERLLQHPEWLEEGYEIVGLELGNSLWPFAKLINKSYLVARPSHESEDSEFLWLDIFPIDAVSDDISEAEKFAKEQKFLIGLGSVSESDPATVSRDKTKIMLAKIARPLIKVFFPTKKMYSKVAKNARLLSYGSTNTVANMAWVGVTHGRWIPITDFENLTTLEFEGYQFNAIPHYHDYLSGLYGDYMQLPPEDKRVTHASRVWRVG